MDFDLNELFHYLYDFQGNNNTIIHLKRYLENRDGYGVITVDGDGQHFPVDVKNCAEEMMRTGEIVLGVRDFSLPNVPKRSRMGNRITSAVFKIFVGMKCSDTQTGLRAVPTALLPQMLDVEGDRYEYETNQLLYMKKHKLGFSEVKITTVYINENETSHFRPVRDSARIYSLIFKYFLHSSFIKFMLSSLVSYTLDLILFYGLGYLLAGSHSEALKVGIPYAGARLCSSFLNYTLNRKVFKDGENTSVKSTIFKYYALAACILLVGSISVTYAVKGLVSIPVVAARFSTKHARTLLNTIVKIPVDCILYVISYNIQKKFIFKAD